MSEPEINPSETEIQRVGASSWASVASTSGTTSRPHDERIEILEQWQELGQPPFGPTEEENYYPYVRVAKLGRTVAERRRQWERVSRAEAPRVGQIRAFYSWAGLFQEPGDEPGDYFWRETFQINGSEFYIPMDLPTGAMKDRLLREQMVASFFRGMSKAKQKKALAALKKMPPSAACYYMARKVGGVYHGFQLQPDGLHRLNHDECVYAPRLIRQYIEDMKVAVNAMYNSLKAETADAPTETTIEKLVRAYVVHHWFKHVKVVLDVDKGAVSLECVLTLYRESVLAEHSVFAGHALFEQLFGQGMMCPNYSDHAELFSDIRDVEVVYTEEMMNHAPGLRSVQGRTYQPCPNMSGWTPFLMTSSVLLSKDEARSEFRLLWRGAVPPFCIFYHAPEERSLRSSVYNGEKSSQVTRVLGFVGPVGTHAPLAGRNDSGVVVRLELLGHLSHCTYCYETSHTRWQCVKQTCARCNTVGHWARDCVNKRWRQKASDERNKTTPAVSVSQPVGEHSATSNAPPALAKDSAFQDQDKESPAPPVPT